MHRKIIHWVILSCAAALLLPSALYAGSQDQDELKLPVVYAVPGMDAVQVRPNLVYSSPEGTDLTANVYLPAAPPAGQRLPAILFIHGGPLPPGSGPKPTEWGVFDSYGRLTAAQGMVGITFNHRLHSWGHLDHAAADISAVIAFVRERAADFHLDPDRIAVWAFSGGGPLLSQFLREKPPYLKAIVSYYAALDLHESQRVLEEIGEDQAVLHSPVRYIGDGDYTGAPIFIARAGRDSAAINRSVETMVRNAIAANALFELMNHPDGRHGFDVRDDVDRSREIIARTFAFIKTRFGEK